MSVTSFSFLYLCIITGRDNRFDGHALSHRRIRQKPVDMPLVIGARSVEWSSRVCATSTRLPHTLSIPSNRRPEASARGSVLPAPLPPSYLDDATTSNRSGPSSHSSNPIKTNNDSTKPCVWRRGRWSNRRNVNAISIV